MEGFAKMDGSYFDDNFFPNQVGNDNDIENDAYQGLESRGVDPLGVMPHAMPPAMPLSMQPYSSQPVATPLHPMFLPQEMGNWDPTFGSGSAGGQFGLLPESRQLFVNPETCDGTANDHVRSQVQMLDGQPLQPSPLQPSPLQPSPLQPSPLQPTRRVSTRRTSSSTSEPQSQSSSGDNSLTDITPPDQSGPRRRRGSKKRDLNEEEDQRRRNKFLERNRIAASKCRDKKKAFMTELEHNKMVLETKNTDLHAERKSLLNEVADLKYRVMAHARCEDPRINKWVAGQADEYVNTPGPAPPGPSHVAPAPVYTGYNPPGPPVLPTTLPAMSPTTRHPLSSPYHPLRHNSFSMGNGEGAPAPAHGMYDPMAAVGDGQGFVPMAARDPRNRYEFMGGGGEGQNRGYEFMGTGAGQRQNSMAYSHASSIFTESYTPSTPTEPIFSGLHSPTPKRESDGANYDDVADDEDQPPYGPA